MKNEDYYLNIAREGWLRGAAKMSLRDRLYVFVKYGGIERDAS
jgi:hypothetical protein